MNIKIFYDEVKFRMKDWKKLVEIIERIIIKENRTPGDLNFVITNDKSLKKINIKFLKHHYFTDVIAFDYNEKNIVNGEIYISLDTVKRNSVNYKVSLKSEMVRVIIHGILHLCGYDDKTSEEKVVIKRMEEIWMGIYFRDN
ncbi:MAG: rRNA maturation RNase YbeY [Bacteroidales bacterium]|nr:rRNA maturation RNase YbeY [Bacteroidales bacterium]